jgi:prolipoprotein diacylglyceryltransferase
VLVYHHLAVYLAAPARASGLLLIAYGVVRFCIECVRVPDEHIVYLTGRVG